MLASRLVLALLAVLAGAGTALAAYGWHGALQPLDDVPAPAPRAAVERGATLAAIGNCSACHSAPGQPPYSGGVPVETPFGTIYGSNLTPDPDTGIGRWSKAAFRRAMREGVGRDGRHLYPAFPYDHFTRLTDADDDALYAYLTSLAPARRTVPPPDLPFPLNVRAAMAGWNLLFFRPGAYEPDPARDAAWNRGAYLVEGLGHCGACHTPRNSLGAEKSDAHLAGGVAAGWNAYALNAASPAPVPWTVDSLAFYLRHGWEGRHGVSRGPMAVVTANLGAVDEAESRAMATYLVSLMEPAAGQPAPSAPPLPPPRPAASAGSQVAVASPASGEGATIYAGACASCHESGRPVPYGGLPLGLSSALHAPDPSNIVTVTVHGLAAPPGAPGAIMPGFAASLDDGQITALLAYLRAEVAREPPWPDLSDTVRRARSRAVTLDASDGTGTAPADTDVRIGPW